MEGRKYTTWKINREETGSVYPEDGSNTFLQNVG
jgi:hypothetical protein